MSDVSRFYTQQASVQSGTDAMATKSPLLKPNKQEVADFLDVMMAALKDIPINQAPTTDYKPVIPATLYSDEAIDLPTELVTDMAVVPLLPIITLPIQLNDTLATNDLTSITPETTAAPILATLSKESGQLLPIEIKPVSAKPTTEILLPATDTTAATPLTVDQNPNQVLANTTENPQKLATKNISENTVDIDDMARQLNAMTVGGDDAATKEKSKFANDLLEKIMRGTVLEDGYQPTLTKGAAGYQSPLTSNDRPTGPTTTSLLFTNTLEGTLTPITPSPDLLAVPTNSNMLSPITTTGFDGKSIAIISSAQSQSALQAVAIHLQQLGANRDTRTLTLQLNPPELGKLQVKMTFGRDKAVKADVLVEKSDTFQMMQKDGDTLRQALQNVGLNTDASSLNFSLAQDGTFMDDRRNEIFKGGRDIANDNDVIGAYEIKSSEEWSVDPSTGLTRYNIWV